MRIELVDLKSQYAVIAEEVREQIESVLASMRLNLGPNVYQLEEEFARYCGVSHAVGVASGTDALHLALRALDIGPGDEVITVPFTFIATVEAIALCGARPVFVDIDPRTYTMDVSQLASAITPRTRAIVPVHLYGLPAEMDVVMEVARAHGLAVVEDACQAHGSEYRGRRVGSLGHMAAFSFYCSKNLGAYGDGGMVVTDDDSLARRVRLLRNHGELRRYHHALLGTTSRLDELQAAVLRVKLRYLDRWNEARRTWAAKYSNYLADLPELVLPFEPAHSKHVYHLYVIRHYERDDLRRRLSRLGIETGVHYPVPSHLQPACAQWGYGPGDFPEAEKAAREVLSLPMYPELGVDHVAYISQAIRDWWRERAGHYMGRRSSLHPGGDNDETGPEGKEDI